MGGEKRPLFKKIKNIIKIVTLKIQWEDKHVK